MKADVPPIETLTPSSVVGTSPLRATLFQLSVMAARLVPRIVAHELGTIDGWSMAGSTPAAKLAPFTTVLIVIGAVEGIVAGASLLGADSPPGPVAVMT